MMEIAPLRTGEYTLAPPWGRLREQVEALWRYMIRIRRTDEPYLFWLYPRTVRKRLPGIHVPLAIRDGFMQLDLQALVNQCYEDGGVRGKYRLSPPPPPFSEEEMARIDALLKAKGLR